MPLQHLKHQPLNPNKTPGAIGGYICNFVQSWMLERGWFETLSSNYYDSFFLVISVWVTDAIPMRNNVTIVWMSYRSPIDCNSPRVITTYRIMNN